MVENKFITLDEVSTALTSTPTTLRSLLSHLTPEQYRWRPADNEWSINEVIGHLIAADQVAFAGRIQLMLEQEHPTLPRVDVDQLASERQDQQRVLDDLLDELTVGRQKSSQLIRSLTPSQLARTGDYPKYGTFLVSDFVYEWPYHDYAHLQQILTIQQEAIWPHFSPSMQQALKS
ncbi:MAG: DinB family protein [Chloroflexota bacterium]